MSIQPGSSPKAQWNDQEVASLLDSLEAYKSKGEGAGNFNDSIFTKVLTVFTPLHTAGPPKTVKHCKTKWAVVCFSFFCSLLLSLIRFSSLNQYTRQFMPINTTSREPIWITPTVRIFKATLLPLFLIHMSLRRFLLLLLTQINFLLTLLS
jgi:hypothetical protein